MNKFGIVLGAAAVVTLAGCKDPDYKHAGATPSQSEAKSVATTVETVEPAAVATCQCLPGTKHTEPCKCGTPDCKCIVESNAAQVPAAAETAYTEYIVQEGDYLAKISKRYNVTLSSIRQLNPSIKKDIIRVGQKIKLPGKVDVGVQKAPTKATVKASKKSATVADYTGVTKEYVVKSGDTLGSVAYGNGLNIRQLKKLNGLTSDSLKIGQKLKVPAEKAEQAPVAKKTEAAPTVAPAKAEEAPAAAPAAPTPVAEEKKETTPAAAPAPAAATATYVVQEGDDMTGVSIRWGVSASEIRELNNLGESDQLVPGQIIKLPAEAQQ